MTYPVTALTIVPATATMKARGRGHRHAGWLAVGLCFGDFHLSRLGAAQPSAGHLPPADVRHGRRHAGSSR